MYDHDWTRKLTLPVKMVNGQWEFLLGGAVPVKDGTLAELTVPLDRITDAEFAKRVTAESTVKVLPAGSTLYVALSDRAGASPRKGLRIWRSTMNTFPAITPGM